MRSRQVPWADLATAGIPVAVGVLSFYGDEPLRDQWHPLIAVNVANAAGLSLATVLLWRDRRHRTTALLLGLATACSAVGWLRVRQPDPLPYLGAVVAPLFWVFLGWALLRYPMNRLERRAEQVFVAGAGAWLLIGHLVENLWLDPAWYPLRWPPDTWWPTIGHSRSAWDHAQFVTVTVDALVAVWYVVLALQRLRRLSEVDRWIVGPLRASIVAAGVPLFLRPVAFVVNSDTAKNALSVVMNLALVLIPIALVAVLVRQRIARTAVADMMAALTSASSTADIRQALRLTLRDPSLDVSFRVPETGEWVDPAGTPIEIPSSADRLRFPLHDSAGAEFGVILTDVRLESHRDLVAAAATAGALALENARLQAALRAQLDQVRASRRRLAEVAVTERRRLERDLHDGVQQRLLALNLQLARMKATGLPAGEVIERTRRELHASLDELRDLAGGIHPAALSQSGLGPALEEVLDRLPFPVTLSVQPGRWPASVESIAYYVVCEALSNVVKHARASLAAVTVRAGQDGLHVAVRDDGRGGARVGTGSGLTGLADRVRALGGEFDVVSAPGDGTLVQVRLPCE